MIPHPTLSTVGVTSRPFPLADGKIHTPGVQAGPHRAQRVGHDFLAGPRPDLRSPRRCGGDHSGELNLCNARYDVLPDGRILALIWTFREDTEETMEVRRSWSSDGGETWTAPENIGFLGQVTAPLVLPDGAVVAASNYRLPTEGIRLWGSLDGGETWGESGPIQMWDAVASRMVGKPLFQCTIGRTPWERGLPPASSPLGCRQFPCWSRHPHSHVPEPAASGLECAVTPGQVIPLPIQLKSWRGGGGTCLNFIPLPSTKSGISSRKLSRVHMAE